MDYKYVPQKFRNDNKIVVDSNFNQILSSLLNQDPKKRTHASELIKISAGMLGNKI